MIDELKNELEKAANPAKAAFLNRFFKTGKGQYGEHDIFIGITVPVQRAIARSYSQLSMGDIQELLSSSIHEYRLVALFILITQFNKAGPDEKKKIYEFYLANTNNINNWDLVDSSAHQIVGAYLIDKDRAILSRLALSGSIWDKRIAMVATYAFIRRHDFTDTLHIAEMLVHERHDLLQKAVGWMLREMGKRDVRPLEQFLQKHHKTMPRTMLRYSIEKFDTKKKDYYLGRMYKERKRPMGRIHE